MRRFLSRRGALCIERYPHGVGRTGKGRYERQVNKPEAASAIKFEMLDAAGMQREQCGSFWVGRTDRV